MSSQPPKALDSLRARVRRFQFIVGLGFFSLIVGKAFIGSLLGRLVMRVADLPLPLQEPAVVILSNFWLLGVLPVLCYGAALVLELKPLSTALGAASTGALFLAAIFTASQGVDGIWGGPSVALLQVAAFAGGVLLSYRSVLAGRAAANQRAQKAQAQAEARKSEYTDFLREAERGAEKSAQREAERSAAVAAAPEAGAAVPAAATEQAGAVAAAESPAASQEPAAAQSEPPAEPKVPTTGS